MALHHSETGASLEGQTDTLDWQETNSQRVNTVGRARPRNSSICACCPPGTQHSKSSYEWEFILSPPLHCRPLCKHAMTESVGILGESVFGTLSSGLFFFYLLQHCLTKPPTPYTFSILENSCQPSISIYFVREKPRKPSDSCPKIQNHCAKLVVPI